MIKTWQDRIYEDQTLIAEDAKADEIRELRASLEDAERRVINRTVATGHFTNAALQERDAAKPPAVLMNQLVNDKLELSAKLAERDAEIGLLNGTLDSRNRNIETLSEVSAAQRKVLEMALEALKLARGMHYTVSIPSEKAIKAIQEQLA